MGHGDDLVIADSNFPAESTKKPVVRAAGHSATDILAAILTLFPLDEFVEAPATVMQRVDHPDQAAPVWSKFQTILDAAEARPIKIERLERFAFYERASRAFGVVATGETALYGNIIIKMGVCHPKTTEPVTPAR